MIKENIKLTGTTLPVIVLYVAEESSNIIFEQLSEKVTQSPQFFNHSPIVIDLGNLPSDSIDFKLNDLVAHCRSLELQPLAFTKVHESLREHVDSLPVLDAFKKQETVAQQQESKSAPSEPAETVGTRTSKLITRPIRSGQQVYAEGTDLIVLAQVSEGSEVIADGNIHIYGALRGKALAGVKGDTSARIFCNKMNAELISIAGRFLLSDDIDATFTNQSVQISLEEESINITPL